MAGFLFSEIVFGPVISRRLGVSLGINLLPTDKKFCTFDCVYCECGWTNKDELQKLSSAMPSKGEVFEALEKRFKELASSSTVPDNITFAGNGEPTIHPDFPEIIDFIIVLRNTYFPKAKVSVLSNATQLHKPEIKEALLKIDNAILKLDAGTKQQFNLINGKGSHVNFSNVVEGLKSFNGNCIIQTLFLRGQINGEIIDNTTPEEVSAWLKLIKEINPKLVMIYPIDRATPAQNLIKIEKQELDFIANQVNMLGIKTEVY